jgi:hypothetical protein
MTALRGNLILQKKVRLFPRQFFFKFFSQINEFKVHSFAAAMDAGREKGGIQFRAVFVLSSTYVHA